MNDSIPQEPQQPAGPDHLQELANSIDIEQQGGAPGAVAPDPGQAGQMQKITAGLGVFTMKVFKAFRQRAARNLPEILEHVTDADLQGVADAVPPVLNKHLARLTPLIGKHPEEAMLVLSTVPLVMGYITALEVHEAKERQKPVNVTVFAPQHP